MHEKRQSVRIVPIGSNEDVVVLHVGEEQHLAKILDLSDGGTCVYTVEPGFPLDVGETCRMSLYHDKNIQDLDVRVSPKNGQVVGLEFQSPSAEVRGSRECQDHPARSRVDADEAQLLAEDYS